MQMRLATVTRDGRVCEVEMLKTTVSTGNLDLEAMTHKGRVHYISNRKHPFVDSNIVQGTQDRVLLCSIASGEEFRDVWALLAVHSSFKVDEGKQGLAVGDGTCSTSAGHLREAFGREFEVAGGEGRGGFAKGKLEGRKELGDGVALVNEFPCGIAFFLIYVRDADLAQES